MKSHPKLRAFGVDSLSDWNDVLDVVVGLYSHHVKSVTIGEVGFPAPQNERLAQHDDLVQDALELRANHGVPFWMSMLLAALHAKSEASAQLIDRAGFHQPNNGVNSRYTLSLDQVGSVAFRSRCEEADNDRMLVLKSGVVDPNSKRRHLPMLDFRLASSDHGLAHVLRVVEKLGQRGAILDSGNSYHFYGADLLTEAAMREFLGRALLYTPIVDYRWIAHQLIDGECALRVSISRDHGFIPRVVETI